MRQGLKAIALIPILSAPTSHAGLISGFEQGLDGWDYLGDVSIQTADIGTAPTQAQHMAFISTMCDGNNPPIQHAGTGLSCQITVNEHPYSGVSSPEAGIAREFLGLPSSRLEFGRAMPRFNQATAGESGAMKRRFFAPQAGTLSFDWNRIGSDGDSAYFSIWSDDPTRPYRASDWIFAYEYVPVLDTYIPTQPFIPSDVQLCTRYYSDPADIERICSSLFSPLRVETGWFTKSAWMPEMGWYWIGFGLGEAAEGTVPTVLALDNIVFSVPEPGTLALFGLGIVVVAMIRRQTITMTRGA